VKTTIGIDVRARPETVFALARDLERWPTLLPHYVSVRALDRGTDGTLLARMIARRPVVPLIGLGIPVAWRARTWAEEDRLRLRFVHQGGATAGMNVTWRIEEQDDGCRVSIDHDFRPPSPIGALWALFIDRAFTRPIAGRTLATFKALAETLDAVAVIDRGTGP
jgi:ribosome-associated toxin RatA of RatAB toxin-antitoxin module